MISIPAVSYTHLLICYDILDLGKQLMPIGMLVVLDSILNRLTQNLSLIHIHTVKYDQRFRWSYFTVWLSWDNLDFLEVTE